jgi:hypothetical protein
MLNTISKENVLTFKSALADSIYRIRPEFIAAAEALPDKKYFVSVLKDTRYRQKTRDDHNLIVSRGGKSGTKPVLVDLDSTLLEAEEKEMKVEFLFETNLNNHILLQSESIWLQAGQ